MDTTCFNCHNKMERDIPICRNCFAVQRNHFSREELFEYLEKSFPTKSRRKPKPIFTEKQLAIRNYWKWHIIALLTFGIGYLVYSVLALRDMNDHWDYPHVPYEAATKNDLLVSIIILISTNFIGSIFIQYVRHEKLYRHLAKAPMKTKKTPIRGRRFAIIYTANFLLFISAAALMVFATSSVVAGILFPKFDPTVLTIAFLTGSIIELIVAFGVNIRVVLYDRNWQEIFNEHQSWHMDLLKSKKPSVATDVTKANPQDEKNPKDSAKET